jgi:sporulation protein YlmC with PRC-barrel domain
MTRHDQEVTMDQDEAGQLIGQELRCTNGERIGRIEQVYLDDEHGQLEWVAVDAGPFGTGVLFVPVMEARFTGRGLAVPYTRHEVRTAPRISGGERPSEAEEQLLYEHYQLSYAGDVEDANG